MPSNHPGGLLDVRGAGGLERLMMSLLNPVGVGENNSRLYFRLRCQAKTRVRTTWDVPTDTCLLVDAPAHRVLEALSMSY